MWALKLAGKTVIKKIKTNPTEEQEWKKYICNNLSFYYYLLQESQARLGTKNI